MSKYCCIFNHYNKNKTINKYVFRLLDFFSSLNCDTIVVSNSQIESEDDKTLLSNRFKGQYFERENKGYDFAAWQYAINRNLIPDDTEYLFLVNDSIIGPLHDINIILDKMVMESGIDFWGLTDSYQVSWHLQSYFLCFKKNVFTSNAFENFFKQNFSSYNKDEIIKNGEILLSSTLVEAGFKGKAFIEYKVLSKEKNSNNYTNPTHSHAEILINKFQFPFIKKELILQNPENIDFENNIFNVIENAGSYPIEYIKEVLINNYNIESDSIIKTKINVFCHIYYNNAYQFLSKICKLKKYNSKFFFNISPLLYNDKYFIGILKSSFPESIILQCPNVGKDIGGKLVMIDLAIKTNSDADLSIFLHDKKSPHTKFGKIWRNKLFRIIETDNIDTIIKLFETDKTLGIISTKEFIANEYDKSSNSFNCTNNLVLQNLIIKYGLKLNTYDFVGGTMFWVRAEIVHSFFSKHSPLGIRGTLERGNVLDHDHGTNTHAWERMLSWIATDQKYSIKGI